MSASSPPPDQKNAPAAGKAEEPANVAAATAGAAPTEPEGPKVSPEDEAKARIEILQGQIKILSQQIRSLQGKVQNRNPSEIARLKKENQELRSRVPKLEKALYALVRDSHRAPSTADIATRIEILRRALVEYCKTENIDQELWKNLAS